MTFGERVKQARLAKGLTQGELAAHLGTNASTISSWEIYGSEPISSFLAPLAEALGADPNTLLGWEEEKPERTESTYTEKKIISVLHDVLAEYLSKELTDTITINVIEALNGKGR